MNKINVKVKIVIIAASIAATWVGVSYLYYIVGLIIAPGYGWYTTFAIGSLPCVILMYVGAYIKFGTYKNYVDWALRASDKLSSWLSK